MTNRSVVPLAPSDRVFVAGHGGMVGSALVRALDSRGVTAITATRKDVDLCDQAATFGFLAQVRPIVVLVAAAKVGGIGANSTYPAEFCYENVAMEANLIEGSRRAGVRRLLFFGSSCIYPRLARQPLKEEDLLTGPLEATNEAYAVAKIAAVKMCSYYRLQYGLDYRSVIPCNLYGPGDNYHPDDSHVIPALVRKFVEAQRSGGPVTLWGTGTPLREFLHADDCADAALAVLEAQDAPETVNVGSGQEISVADLAAMVAKVTDFEGTWTFDATKPDGTPRKVLECSALNQIGWRPKINLEEGLHAAVLDYKERLLEGGVRR